MLTTFPARIELFSSSKWSSFQSQEDRRKAGLNTPITGRICVDQLHDENFMREFCLLLHERRNKLT